MCCFSLSFERGRVKGVSFILAFFIFPFSIYAKTDVFIPGQDIISTTIIMPRNSVYNSGFLTDVTRMEWQVTGKNSFWGYSEFKSTFVVPTDVVHLGVGYGWFGVQDIPRVVAVGDKKPVQVGVFGHRIQLLYLQGARKIIEEMTIGVQVNFIHQSLAENVSRGVGIDASVLFEDRGGYWGVTLKNMLPLTFSWEESGHKDVAESYFVTQIGMSWEILSMELLSDFERYKGTAEWKMGSYFSTVGDIIVDSSGDIQRYGVGAILDFKTLVFYYSHVIFENIDIFDQQDAVRILMRI